MKLIMEQVARQRVCVCVWLCVCACRNRNRNATCLSTVGPHPTLRASPHPRGWSLQKVGSESFRVISFKVLETCVWQQWQQLAIVRVLASLDSHRVCGCCHAPKLAINYLCPRFQVTLITLLIFSTSREPRRVEPSCAAIPRICTYA